MKILYFAHFREKTNISEELVSLPENVKDVSSLIDWLSVRNNGFAEAFADRDLIRVALNHEHVKFDSPVKKGDEIAFFPPMTGG
jgi:molybdopterin synthase sulfur carrier subunit